MGATQGKGTYQFNDDTIKAMERMLSQIKGGRRVNSVFGEGANPRLRKIRGGLDALKLPSSEFLSHGTPRLVYALNLVSNLAEYLLGMEKRPKWIADVTKGEAACAGTKAISDHWRERWMLKRVQDDEVMARVREDTAVYPVTHRARVWLPKTLDDQMDLWEQ